MLKDTEWQVAEKSAGNGGSCFELRRKDGMIEVRDTKDRDGGTLRFRLDELDAFLDGARRGEFDHLLTD